MYKKISFFQLDKLPVGRTVVQLVPAAFGFSDDALFEFLECFAEPSIYDSSSITCEELLKVGIWGWTHAVDKD